MEREEIRRKMFHLCLQQKAHTWHMKGWLQYLLNRQETGDNLNHQSEWVYEWEV